ncbi:MAG: hypothetical protein BMS9Abin17_1454 [Acidimicrobiia bacterium]|nr:MAG: hypothetical protein BMS9Abin17_1454 [Acidimicrobiia bacterium]
MGAEPTSLDLLRAVLDPTRLATLGAGVNAEVSIGELADRLGVTHRDVADAIGSLRASGFLTQDGRTDELALRAIARTLPAKEPGRGEPVAGPWTQDEADILGRFFAQGRLAEIPASAKKRRLILEKIALEFEPGLRYAERDVNFTIQLIHHDYASIRRYMVDEGFLERADGVYWRTGGRHETPTLERRAHIETQGSLMTRLDTVVLRPYDESMVVALVAAANDVLIERYMGDQFPFPYTIRDAQQWMEIATAHDPPMHYAVFVDGVLLGGVGGSAFSGEASGVVEIGWWLNPAYWGSGITTAAVATLVDEFFSRGDYVRLWAPVMKPNIASARVAEKVGMTLEGVGRDHYFKHGERLDQLNYAITSSQREEGG